MRCKQRCKQMQWDINKDVNKDVNKCNEMYTKAKQQVKGILISIFMFIALRIKNVR